MKLIAGLGNIGKEYDNTRHNAGFLAVRWLAEIWQEGEGWREGKFAAYTVRITGKDIMLAQPTTMMNESGRAVRALMDFYHIDPSGVTIIHDDADLDVGEIKKVESASTGAGHHGVLSVMEHIGPGFKRIRIGIGRPDQPVRDIAGWVLKPLPESDRAELLRAFEQNLENLLEEG